ncbi:hypothetical protein [Methylobacterium segetis]|uniref:hypothetical protein n=1 Tax=Methylobacterium segetis TaxID=2488750 RepID=UPI00104923E8|nr:hypothetical protein [Methylobacterium segetis]
MNDALWTEEATRKAVVQWIEGRDASEIAAEFGTTPEDVVRRVAQAAQTLGAKPKKPASAAAPRPAAPAPARTNPNPRTAEAAAPTPRILPRTEPPAPKAARSEVIRRAASAPAPTTAAARAVPAAPSNPVPRAPVALSVPAPTALAVPGTAPESPTGGPALPTTGARRPLVAADGGEGVPFMKAGLLDCVFPLWSDHEGGSIETKRVCGCRVVTGKRWCPQHYAIVFEPLRKPQRAA